MLKSDILQLKIAVAHIIWTCFMSYCPAQMFILCFKSFIYRFWQSKFWSLNSKGLSLIQIILLTFAFSLLKPFALIQSCKCKKFSAHFLLIILNVRDCRVADTNLNFYCQLSGSSKGRPLLYFGVKKQCHLNHRWVINSKWDKGGISKVHILRGD